jgi:hypothetical protein
VGGYRELTALAVLAVVGFFTVRSLCDLVAGTVAEWGALDLLGRLTRTLLIALGLFASVFYLAVAWLVAEDLDPYAIVCGARRLLTGTAGGYVGDVVDEVASLDRELMEALIGSKGCRHHATITVPVGMPLRLFHTACSCYNTYHSLVDSVVFHVFSDGTSVAMVTSDRELGKVAVGQVSSLLELAVNLSPEGLAKVSDLLREVGCDPLSDLELEVYRELHRVVSGMRCRGSEVLCRQSCPAAMRLTKLLVTLRELAARVALAS